MEVTVAMVAAVQLMVEMPGAASPEGGYLEHRGKM
jgi:hypothetical protein